VTVRPFRDEPNLWTHQGFLLAEDEAIKAHLSGMLVPGRESTAPKVDVGVWFRWPEGERQIKYPFITIDLLSAEPNFSLFTSDYIQPSKQVYRPSFSPKIPAPPDGWDTQSISVRNFLPMTLQYQVAVHARSALHDRYLHSIFATDVFPPRPFWVWCKTDEKWRRTEVTQAVTSDLSETTESGTKRIFRKVYTVSMLAEIPQDVLTDSYVYRALRVLIPIVELEEFDNYYLSCLNNVADPIGTIPDSVREDHGELSYVAHGGVEVPLPS
jgi:hypothetical protein